MTNTFDPFTTKKMVASFGAAESECDRIQRIVDDAHGLLAQSWTGTASRNFSGSLTDWMAGFAAVQSALHGMDSSMHYYDLQSSQAEDANLAQARWSEATAAAPTAGAWATQ